MPKRGLTKNDDSWLDLIVKVATVSTFIWGVIVFMHTIYPVFAKEKELLEAKDEIEKLKSISGNLNNEINDNNKILAQLKADVAIKEARVTELAQQLSEAAAKEYALKRTLDASQSEAQRNHYEAVQAHLARITEALARDVIDSQVRKVYNKSDPDFDLQKRALEVAAAALKDTTKDKPEREAYSELEKYAHERLKPGIKDFGTIFMIRVYYIEKTLNAGRPPE
jgi:septal ring factor EnvC (AmiA/AmiB activator)